MPEASMTTKNIRRTGTPASKKGVRNPAYPHLSTIVVDDPYALDHGDKTTAIRNTRRDPLAALHAR